MLEDRDYMRESSGGVHWSATIVLLVVNLVVFLLQPVLFRNFDEGYFTLSLYGLKHGWVWQLLTFQFLHAGWLHLIFNSLALFFFGRVVEMALGRMRFLQLYFASGVIGGLLHVLLALAMPRYFDAGVLGASAGVSGLIAAFAVLNWQNRFTLLIYFFPVNMRGRTLFWASIVLALIGMATPGSGVAHAAHLGGLLAGAAFIRFNVGMRQMPWEFRPLDNRRRKRGLVKAAITKIPGWHSKDVISADLPEEEFISREVDPILEKISAHGIQSLTAHEREVLEKARSKMGRR